MVDIISAGDFMRPGICSILIKAAYEYYRQKRKKKKASGYTIKG